MWPARVGCTEDWRRKVWRFVSMDLRDHLRRSDSCSAPRSTSQAAPPLAADPAGACQARAADAQVGSPPSGTKNTTFRVIGSREAMGLPPCRVVYASRYTKR